MGRPLARRSVGSTLLLKGLEAEISVILDAEALDARNFYVAMTRLATGPGVFVFTDIEPKMVTITAAMRVNVHLSRTGSEPVLPLLRN